MILVMDVSSWSATEVERFLISKGFSESVTEVLKGKSKLLFQEYINVIQIFCFSKLGNEIDGE